MSGASNVTVTIEKLCSQMEGFGLKHSSKVLADTLDAAEKGVLTPRQFLASLMDTETKGRNEKRRQRNYAGAHFPPNVKALEEFDPAELDSGISAGQIRILSELNWIESFGNIIFAGPPGLGKTMIATSLGVRAVDEGYLVCFEKMENLVAILDRADIDRAAGFRLNNIKRANVLICDEVGYTPITKNQANKFFTLVSDMYERSSLIITTNKAIPEWAEVMGDPVLTTALLDRILHHARCFSFEGESYRLKHPDVFA